MEAVKIIISFAEKLSCCQRGPGLQRLSHGEVGCMKGLHGHLCGLSLCRAVARKSDTQPEPTLAGAASSRPGHPFLGCFCPHSLLANANQHGATAVVSAAPQKGKMDTDASSTRENESSCFILWPCPGQAGKPNFCPCPPAAVYIALIALWPIT